MQEMLTEKNFCFYYLPSLYM